MMKKLYVFLSVLLAGAVAVACNGNPASPVPVLLDTDTGNDIDDVLAMEMLFNYEDQGKIDLKGISLSKCNPYTISYVDAYCQMHGRGDMPLGYAYDGPNTENSLYTKSTLESTFDGHRILTAKRDISSDVPEGFKMLRQVLAGCEDRSVVFIAIGPETNLARLLASSPDEYSELDGMELVARKVKFLSVMGGLYADGYDFPEWNIQQDISSAKKVFSEWPTPIVASGWELGNSILYPHESIERDFSAHHPLRVSYGFFGKMPYDRPTWDLTSVLFAIEPEAGHFNISEPGTIEIDAEGYSHFRSDEHGKHRFLSLGEDEAEKYIQESLVNQVSGKLN